MPDTVRSFCADVHEYVKSDGLEPEERESLEKFVLDSSDNLGLANDRSRFQQTMMMLEKTGVLPQLLFQRLDKIDQDGDRELDRDEIDNYLRDGKGNILDKLSAAYAQKYFDEIRSGNDLFDCVEDLEEGEMYDKAEEGKEEPEMNPEEVFYGQVTKAPPIGEDDQPATPKEVTEPSTEGGAQTPS